MVPEKREGLNQVFAGIELDSLNREAKLPLEKVDTILSAIRNLLPRKRVQLKELQSLVGLFNFACSIKTPCKAFIPRLINRLSLFQWEVLFM